MFDLESTGLRNKDLIWGTKYYVERYFGKNNNIRVGATAGNSVPAPNSELEDFDFWMVEAYNLFGARFIEEDRCEQFIVDSLPETRSGLCGRECKNLMCSVVIPTCDTSLYEQHQNDPFSLKESFRNLILPNETEASMLR